MIIGSAGDTGSNSRVDSVCGIIRELAAKHGLRRSSSATSIPRSTRNGCAAKIRSGAAVAGSTARRPDEAELDATDRIVAMAGVHPFIGCSTGRRRHHRRALVRLRACSPRRRCTHGYPEALSYYLGKVLECASFCAEPYGGKETVMGEITPPGRARHRDAPGAALHRRLGRRPCDVRALQPVRGIVAGGCLDMSELPLRADRASAPRASPARASCPERMRVKLEGAGKVGERYVGLVGIRDPYTIAHVDKVIGWAREQARERFGNAATSCTTRSTAATA
jgi:hypothetical protein